MSASTYRRVIISMVVVIIIFSGLVLWVGIAFQHSSEEFQLQEQLRCERWIAEQKDALLAGTQHRVHFYSSCDTDELVSEFAGMPEIQSLTFELTDLSNDGMKIIADLPSLSELTLYGGNPCVGDAGLELLAGKQSIKNLKLINTDVTDGGLRTLSSLPALTDLTLYYESFRKTTLTDGAVRHLSKLGELKKLNISGGWMSEEAIGKLRLALPNCEITTDAQW